ncbi:acid phosphatase [Cryptosporangium phraense]|uniref:Acid phosphatase n=2 Tax=Cryptosporangium phraense TaxID=2593070 RepID=A0A545AVU7_9ACTN|nr:acid phosphatase [Cryptosporangium phraense]
MAGHTVRWQHHVVALVATGLVASGCTAASPAATPPAPVPAGAGRLPHPDHVIVVVFENKARQQITRHAPYLTGLARRSANLTGSYALTHPSQPNYFALFSGSTQGVTDDRCVPLLHDRANLAQQLHATGLRFTAYSEGLPRAGFRGCHHGRYAAKHNPWVAFADVPDTANQPYTAWPTAFRQLPTVGFVIPDLCHDMHDCPVADGDRWARTHLDAYARWASAHNSLLIVTFDENDGRPGNQIFTLIAGAHIRPGQYRAPVSQYRLLRTIEAFYGLPALGHATETPPITGVWA